MIYPATRRDATDRSTEHRLWNATSRDHARWCVPHTVAHASAIPVRTREVEAREGWVGVFYPTACFRERSTALARAQYAIFRRRRIRIRRRIRRRASFRRTRRRWATRAGAGAGGRIRVVTRRHCRARKKGLEKRNEINSNNKNETIYLKHIEDIIEKKTNRAEILLEKFNKQGDLEFFNYNNEDFSYSGL